MRCFTWFLICGLGEPYMYHQSVCFTRMMKDTPPDLPNNPSHQVTFFWIPTCTVAKRIHPTSNSLLLKYLKRSGVVEYSGACQYLTGFEMLHIVFRSGAELESRRWNASSKPRWSSRMAGYNPLSWTCAKKSQSQGDPTSNAPHRTVKALKFLLDLFWFFY